MTTTSTSTTSSTTTTWYPFAYYEGWNTGSNGDPLGYEWTVNEGSGSVDIQSSKARFDNDSNANFEQTAQLDADIDGDFDIQVDVDVIDDYTGTWVAGIKIVSQDDSAKHAAVWIGQDSGTKIFRFRYDNDALGNDGTTTVTGRTLTSSALRLIRTGTTLKAYYHDGSKWVQIGSDETWTADACDFILRVFHGSTVTGQNRIDFDDVLIYGASFSMTTSTTSSSTSSTSSTISTTSTVSTTSSTASTTSTVSSTSTTSSTASTTSTVSTTSTTSSTTTTTTSSTTTTTAPPSQQHVYYKPSSGGKFKKSGYEVLFKLEVLFDVFWKDTDNIIFKNDFVRWKKGNDISRIITEMYYMSWVQKTFTETYALAPLISKVFTEKYNLAADISKEFIEKYDIKNINDVSKEFTEIYSLINTEIISQSHSFEIRTAGQMLNVLEFNIACDEGSYCYSFSAELATRESWDLCEANNEIVFNVNGKLFYFLIDTSSRDRSFGKTKYIVTGRSKTKKLDFPYADPYSKAWGTTTAYTAIAELCALQNIDLSFEIVDWSIPSGRLTSSEESPLSIIKRIADATGAVVQTDTDGTLIIRYDFEKSPTRYDESAADITITDTTDVFMVGEFFEQRKKYNKVHVIDSDFADEPQGLLFAELDEVRNSGRTTFAEDESIFIRVYYDAAYELDVSGGTATLIAEEETRTVEGEVLQFVGEEPPETQYPIDSLDDFTWWDTDLGTVTKSGQKKVIAQSATSDTLGIGKAEYTTKYDVWQIEPPELGLDSFKILLRSEK